MNGICLVFFKTQFLIFLLSEYFTAKYMLGVLLLLWVIHFNDLHHPSSALIQMLLHPSCQTS